MTIDWRAELLSQLEFYWQAALRPRLNGMTDAEYLWEPVAKCWSVRPHGDGGATMDWAFPEPSPPPVTTIAWRLCHIAGFVFALRTSNHFGDGSWSPDRRDWPVTAAAGINFLEDSYRRWHDAVAQVDAGPLGTTQRARRRPLS